MYQKTLRACVLAGAVALLLLIPPMASAQLAEVPIRLSLDLAHELLLETNPEIRAARQNIAAARADVLDASLWPNPRVGFDSENYALSAAARSNGFLDEQNLVVRVEQLLETGGKRGKRTAVAEKGVAAEEAALADTVRRLRLELDRNYWRVVLAAEQLGLAEQILADFDRILSLSRERYRQGEASGLEVARLATERLRFFEDRAEAELALRNAKVALLALIGVDDLDRDFVVVEELALEPANLDLATLERQALESRPDLAGNAALLQQADARVSYAQALAVPDITPFVGYNRNFGQDAIAFGVSLDLPLTDRNQGGVARAVAERGRQTEALRRARLMVRAEVRNAVREVETRRELAQSLARDYVPAAERAREISEASYVLGALDLIEFLDAQRAYRETLRRHKEALFEYELARSMLRAVVADRGES